MRVTKYRYFVGTRLMSVVQHVLQHDTKRTGAFLFRSLASHPAMIAYSKAVGELHILPESYCVRPYRILTCSAI